MSINMFTLLCVSALLTFFAIVCISIYRFMKERKFKNFAYMMLSMAALLFLYGYVYFFYNYGEIGEDEYKQLYQIAEDPKYRLEIFDLLKDGKITPAEWNIFIINHKDDPIDLEDTKRNKFKNRLMVMKQRFEV